MNLGSIIFGFFVLACVIVGVVFIAANSANATVTDTYGNTYNQISNNTSSVSAGITGQGVGLGASSLLIVGCLVVIGAVGMFVVVSKS